MSTPSILLRPGVANETQDLDLTTVKLTPNSHSNFQTRFQIPRNGDLLDSNSSLVWRVSWRDFDSAKFLVSPCEELVSLKFGSGGLPTIQRARFYIGGKEVFSCEDVGHLIHIRNLSNNPDYRSEVEDMELAGAHGFFQADGDNGKYQIVKDGSFVYQAHAHYSRAVGSYSDSPLSNYAVECRVLLSDVFSALQSVQIPMDIGDMRIEIDWNTTFDEVACVVIDSGDTITAARKNIDIKEPVLLLDYLTVDDMDRAGLSEMLTAGQVIPFVHTSIATKVIPANATATSQTVDVPLALQGKLLMKMYVSHRLNDTDAAGEPVAPYKLQGRCRSQRNAGFEYNLYVNDLAIHDVPVETASEQASFMEMALQAPMSLIPGQIDYKSSAAAVADTDVNSAELTMNDTDVTGAGGSSLTQGNVRNGIRGTQAYLGFDLAKYDTGSRVVPANAGYRVGSSPVILRITETGSATADSPEARAKTVQVFTEEVKILQIFGKSVEIVEA